MVSRKSSQKITQHKPAKTPKPPTYPFSTRFFAAIVSAKRSPDWPRDCFSHDRFLENNIARREASMTFLNINLRKGILWSVLAIPGLILPAFAQQEVDPTYYDPWAAAPKVVAHPVHTTANHKMVVRKKDPSVARAKETHPTQARANMPPAAQKVTLQLALK